MTLLLYTGYPYRPPWRGVQHQVWKLRKVRNDRALQALHLRLLFADSLWQWAQQRNSLNGMVGGEQCVYEFLRRITCCLGRSRALWR